MARFATTLWKRMASDSWLAVALLGLAWLGCLSYYARFARAMCLMTLLLLAGAIVLLWLFIMMGTGCRVA